MKLDLQEIKEEITSKGDRTNVHLFNQLVLNVRSLNRISDKEQQELLIKAVSRRRRSAGAVVDATPVVVKKEDKGCVACGDEKKPVSPIKIEVAGGGKKVSTYESLIAPLDSLGSGKEKNDFVRDLYQRVFGVAFNGKWSRVTVLELIKNKVNGNSEEE